MKFVVFLVAISFLIGPSVFLAEPQTGAEPSQMRGNETGSVIMLSGRVVTDANSPPPESVNIVLECGVSEVRAQAQSDSRGYFNISVKLTDSPSVTDSGPVSNGGPMTSTSRMNASLPRDNSAISATELPTCDLMGNLPGYTSDRIQLVRGAGIGVVDVGTIVLHSVKQDQAFTVSVTSLAAPDKAKVAFEKGEEQKKKGKWAAAVESFRKAIAAYPRYALAWLELGRVQVKQSEFVDAHESFRESIKQDSKLADGYVELAQLAVQQRQWKDLADATDHLVQMNPDAVEYWFLNSAANFNLGNTKQAEVNVIRGLRLDSGHRVPQLEYLYGLILVRKQDYPAAAEHISAYLKLLPQGPDAQNAQRMLADFQKRAQPVSR
jgi:tetratricopeptide (TPR) repeat protein